MARYNKIKNIYKLTKDCAEIIITRRNGDVYKAIIDREDYEKVCVYQWSMSHKYVATPKGILLHRLILGVTDSKQKIDHADLNTLNNRKYNLRLCNNSQNGANRKSQINNTTGYKGVRWYEKLKKWNARIRVNGQLLHLGYFETIDRAIEAYNKASIMYFGEFARPNQIGGVSKQCKQEI